MERYPFDPESKNSFVYTGGTISTSGSAVVPEFNAGFYDRVAKYYQVFNDNPNDKTEFGKEIRKFYIEQMKKEARYDEETFRSQKKYGVWIFIIVIILVVSGIVFSIMQLRNAMIFGNYSQLATTLEIQKAGTLALNTSALGAFVLIVSLLFFFLFLQYVYKPNSKRKNFFENINDVSKLMDEKE